MKTLILTIVTGFLSLSCYGAIKCSTQFGEKSFTIENDNKIAFHQQKQNRSISSIASASTMKTYRGFKKVTYHKGQKHMIAIENTKNFNSDNDFMTVTSPDGHKMTFPITCNLLD